MARGSGRAYDFVFVRHDGGEMIEVRGYGNVKTSAERSARGKLRRDHKVDPTAFYTHSTTFVDPKKAGA